MWWEMCWAPELGLGRLFSSLEGSVCSLRPGWDGASPSSLVKCLGVGVEGALGNLTAQPRWVCSGLFRAHCLCTSSVMAHLGPPGTPDLLAGPRVAFLACAALTAQHPGHPAPVPWRLQGGLGVLGSLAAQMSLPIPCSPSSWHICPRGAGAVRRCSGSLSAPLGSWEPRGGAVGPAAGQLCMA